MHSDLDQVPEIPEINFEKEMVLIHSMGMQASGGYSIRTERIEDSEDRIRVFTRLRKPSPQCLTSSSFTAPVEVVRTDRGMKEVFFVIETEVYECK